tara:strand:- start:135 stop:548 length:414 start_codon:yes stop_codon:yes gene_type:complete
MANIPVVSSSVYTGNVEIVLGPINGKVYVRPLEDGTSYSNDSIDQLVDRMHEIAKAEKAFMGVFAPGLKEKLKTDKFTSKQLLEHAEKHDVNHVILFKSRIVTNKETGEKSVFDSPYVACLVNDVDGNGSKAKIRVY